MGSVSAEADAGSEFGADEVVEAEVGSSFVGELDREGVALRGVFVALFLCPWALGVCHDEEVVFVVGIPGSAVEVSADEGVGGEGRRAGR